MQHFTVNLSRRRFICAAVTIPVVYGPLHAIAKTQNSAKTSFAKKLDIVADALIPVAGNRNTGLYLLQVAPTGWQGLRPEVLSDVINELEKRAGSALNELKTDSLKALLESFDEECFSGTPPAMSDKWKLFKRAMITEYASSQEGAGNFLNYAPVPAMWLPDVPSDKAKIFYNDWLAMWFS